MKFFQSNRFRAVSAAVLAALILCSSLFLTSCSSFMEALDENLCQNLTDTMLEDYFAAPDRYRWDKVCEPGYNPESLTKDQAELLRYVAGRIKYSYDGVVFDDKGERAKVAYKFRKVPDMEALELVPDSISGFKNEIKSLDVIDFEVTFQCVKDDGTWMFHSLSKFGKYFIHPFCDLVITEDGGKDPEPTAAPTEPLSSDAEDIKDKYLTSVWYDVETGNPLEASSVANAYAVQNVFYFTYPVTGTFEARLVNGEGEEVLKQTIEAKELVTIVCDFSAGHEGWGTFSPGNYYVELFYGGLKIGESDKLKVN